MNAREGDGEDSSTREGKRREDGNHWLGSSNSDVSCPELDALINWVTLKKKTEYKTRRKKERQTDNAQNLPVWHDTPPFLHCIVAYYRHDNMRPRAAAYAVNEARDAFEDSRS